MSAPTVPFRPPASVPIVGQPFTFQQWFPTALLRCNCEAHTALLIQGIGVPAFCPACQRGALIQAVQLEPLTGQVGLAIAPVMQAQPAIN